MLLARVKIDIREHLMFSYTCMYLESSRHDVFVAEIGQPSPGRLFSLDFIRPHPIRAYMARDDAILILYKDCEYIFSRE